MTHKELDSIFEEEYKKSLKNAKLSDSKTLRLMCENSFFDGVIATQKIHLKKLKS